MYLYTQTAYLRNSLLAHPACIPLTRACYAKCWIKIVLCNRQNGYALAKSYTCVRKLRILRKSRLGSLIFFFKYYAIMKKNMCTQITQTYLYASCVFA